MIHLPSLFMLIMITLIFINLGEIGILGFSTVLYVFIHTSCTTFRGGQWDRGRRGISSWLRTPGGSDAACWVYRPISIDNASMWTNL